MDVVDRRTGLTFRLFWSNELRDELRRFNDANCTHPETELRVRIVKGGATQRRPQCLVCGERTGTALRAVAGESLPPDDEELGPVLN